MTSAGLSTASPAISVLLPAYNAELFLKSAIESILAQTFGDFELLIIDDGSTDGTRRIAEAVEDPRARVVVNERNLGLSATLNRGLREARGEFVARQDADDHSEPERFALQIAALRASPELLLIGSCGRQFDAEGRFRGELDLPLRPLAIRWSMLFQNVFLHTSVMYRREAVCATFGGYDESYAICQDYELWGRIVRRAPAANLPQRLVTLRVHATSLMGSGPARLAEETMRVQAAQIEAELPGAVLTPRELELLEHFRDRLEPAETKEFWELFRHLRVLFCAAHPEAEHDPDFRGAMAAKIVRVGYNLLPEHRVAALGALMRGVAIYPEGALRIPWTRVAALFVLGRSARALYDRLAVSQ